MVVQPGLGGTWLETPKTGFLTTRLNYKGHTSFRLSGIANVRFIFRQSYSPLCVAATVVVLYFTKVALSHDKKASFSATVKVCI